MQRSSWSVELVVGSASTPGASGVGGRPRGPGATPPARDPVPEPEGVPRRATPEAVRVLKSLQRDLELVVSQRPDDTLRACRSDQRDLVVIEGPLGDGEFRLLERLRHSGPPVLVVGEESEARTLEALRRGAADCVRGGPDLSEVLPEVALDHIRRWRRQRAQGRAEQRLHRLERMSAAVASQLPLGIVVLDGRGRVVEANPAARRLVGAGLAGPVDQWLAGGGDTPSPAARTLEAGERIVKASAWVRREDDRRVPVTVSSAPWSPDPGDASTPGEREARGAVLILDDRSELEELQRQVLQAEKMASIGELAAGVAHEINNPMGFIHANLAQMREYLQDLSQLFAQVDALQKALGEGSAEDVARASAELERRRREIDVSFVLGDFETALRESSEGAERIRLIVADLREFSHQGRAELEWADLNRCLDSTANIVWTTMKHSVRLEKDYAELPRVRCHAGRLQQVFLNLLVNAYQAIEEQLAGSAGMGTIHIATALAEEEVRISFRDSGRGIAPEDLARIFDPFFTTKEPGAGTGLGLSTSYRIVESHGGRIEVESSPGEGTRFDVWLPVDGPAEPGEEFE